MSIDVPKLWSSEAFYLKKPPEQANCPAVIFCILFLQQSCKVVLRCFRAADHAEIAVLGVQDLGAA